MTGDAVHDSANVSDVAIWRRIALVTAQEARALDEDLFPLAKALHHAGVDAQIVCWDAPQDWSRFDMLLLRSTWDYMSRLEQFLSWAEAAARVAVLANPLPMVRWNIDKHYLGELARAGVPVVPTTFLEPAADVAAAVAEFLTVHDCSEFVVKPAIGAGSRDAQRHHRDARARAVAHAGRLLGARRSVLLQPYLSRVDDEGEAALIFFAGEFSHSIRKGPLLQPGGAATAALFAPESVSPRSAAADEMALARSTFAALPFEMPLYARVDIIRDRHGQPLLLELELIEPSLFFAHAPEAAARFAACIRRFAPAAAVPL